MHIKRLSALQALTIYYNPLRKKEDEICFKVGSALVKHMGDQKSKFYNFLISLPSNPFVYLSKCMVN